jgi:PTS system glucitol/sorbitol-specific IIB component
MADKKYHKIKIKAGPKGWGGPLTIEPTDKRNIVYCVTGGGIHPLAAKIAELCGGTPFDGFKSRAPFEQIAVCIIDCGGTARVGVYPMKKVPTVDIIATSPAGPLFRFITEDIFVSGVREQDIEVLD